MMADSVSVVIPAYNEAHRIGPTLERVCAHLSGRAQAEVLVVDDGSTDRTAAVVRDVARRHAHIRLVRHPEHLGKGAAVRTGVLQASGVYVCFADADLSTPIEELDPMLARLAAGDDVVIGTRAHADSRIHVRQHPAREAMGKIFNRMARAVVRVPWTDTQCGFKGFRREAAQAIFRCGRINSFAFDVEVLRTAQALGLSVHELPVRWAHVPSSRVNPLVHSWQMLGELWRIRRQFDAPRADGAQVSVIILTKNEEARIGRCLASVAWADEIIVVDGMSTDHTVEICESHGARVIRHAFEGSFAQERNLGLEAARGPWVLQLDADDVVTPRFREAVERTLRADTPYDVIKFRRKSYLLGRFMRHGGWYHYLPNLVRREAVRYVGDVHERPVLRASPMAPVLAGQIEADIEHHPCGDLAEFLLRHNRYTTLAAREWCGTGHPVPAIAPRVWKAWWKTYVKKQGFREGMHGLVFSSFFAGVELLKWAKCVEPSEGATARWVARRNRLGSRLAQRLCARRRLPGPAVAFRMAWEPAVVWHRVRRRGRTGDPHDRTVRAGLRAFARVLVWAKYWEQGLVDGGGAGERAEEPATDARSAHALERVS